MEVGKTLQKLVIPQQRLDFLVAVLGMFLLALLPLFLSTFKLLFATEMLILALYALSFNLLFGYTGLLSFGHAAYFGVGAYTASLILMRVSPSLPLAIAGAVIASALAALVIGYFCVRLDEIYFAMLTLAFAQMIHALVWQWDELTGGSDGLLGIPRPPIGFLGWEIDISGPTPYYYLTLIVVGVCVFILWRIVNSPFGLTLCAIRENPERVEFIGLPMQRYRLLAFVVSGAFAGVAGAVFAPFQRAAVPEILFWTKSAEPVLISLLGGVGVFWGPAVGAVIFTVIKEVISSATETWMLWVGLIVIVLVIFLPGGIASFLYEEFRVRLAPGIREAAEDGSQ